MVFFNIGKFKHELSNSLSYCIHANSNLSFLWKTFQSIKQLQKNMQKLKNYNKTCLNEEGTCICFANNTEVRFVERFHSAHPLFWKTGKVFNLQRYQQTVIRTQKYLSTSLPSAKERSVRPSVVICHSDPRRDMSYCTVR